MENVKQTGFEAIITRLEAAVLHTTLQSKAFRDKIDKLDRVYIESEHQPQSSEITKIEETPITVLVSLNTLIYQLETINAKNDEVLASFNTLI